MNAATLRLAAEQGLAAVKVRLREPATRSHLKWSLAILVLALAVRAVWVMYAPSDPAEGRTPWDVYFYHNTGVLLSEGRGYVHPWTGVNTALWPPGYSLFLGGLYRLFGPDAAVAWGANIVLGALTCVILYVLGCVMVSRRVGAIAGLLLAIFPGYVFYSSLLVSEILFTFLVVVAMTLVVLAGQKSDTGWLRIVIIGAVVGTAALVRGQGLLLVVVAGLFWWLYAGGWERALQWTVVVGLTCVAVIIPWTIRNYVAMNGFVFLSTNDGYNLYMGNHEGATGGYMLWTDMPIPEQVADLPPSEGEVAASNAQMREGLKFMVTHPWEELQLVGAKLRRLHQDDEESLLWIGSPYGDRPLEHQGALADLANGSYFSMLAVSAGGLLYWWRRPRSAVVLPLLVVAIFTLGQLIFFATSRFHVPMLPSFCLLAAVGILAAVEPISARRRRMIGAGA